MQTGWNKIIRPRLSYKWMIYLLSFIVICTSNPIWGKIPDQLLNEMEIIGQQKNKGEDFARRLKKSYAKKEITERELGRGESLYIDAKAAFNAWIDRVKIDLKSGRGNELSKAVKTSLQTAVEKSEKFTDYVEKLLYGEVRAPSPLPP